MCCLHMGGKHRVTGMLSPPTTPSAPTGSTDTTRRPGRGDDDRPERSPTSMQQQQDGHQQDQMGLDQAKREHDAGRGLMPAAQQSPARQDEQQYQSGVLTRADALEWVATDLARAREPMTCGSATRQSP